MRVGLYFDSRLPVRKYGGTERVVVWLGRGLARLGHEPILITPPGSRVTEIPSVGIPKDAVRRMAFEPGFRIDPYLPAGLDVLHCHSQVRGDCNVPRIITIHGNASEPDFGPEHVFVSRDHMRRMGGTHFVHNGIDPDDYVFAREKEDFLLFLGLASRSVKGVDRAQRIARRAGARLVIAGGRRLNLTPKVKFVGLVDDRRKRELLSRARALLNPIRWEEPFGLVVVEALASGTPVLASRRGAMPELVTPDVGFLCDDDEAFVRALESVSAIDATACRARVEGCFTHLHMARGYVRLYELAIAGRLDEPHAESPL